MSTHALGMERDVDAAVSSSDPSSCEFSSEESLNEPSRGDSGKELILKHKERYRVTRKEGATPAAASGAATQYAGPQCATAGTQRRQAHLQVWIIIRKGTYLARIAARRGVAAYEAMRVFWFPRFVTATSTARWNPTPTSSYIHRISR